MSPKREQMTDDKWCPSTAGPAATSVNLKWKWKHQPKANGHKRADNYFQEDLEDTFCRPFICCICSQRVTALVSQIQITLRPAGLSCLIPLHFSWHPIWNPMPQLLELQSSIKADQWCSIALCWIPVCSFPASTVVDQPAKYYITLGKSIHAEQYHFLIMFVRREQKFVVVVANIGFYHLP